MMDLKMEVYSPFLDLLGLLEVHRSVIWEERAFSSGSFSVESLITDESLTLLQPENIIWIEGETAGIIDCILEEAGKNGPYITAKGPTLTGIFDRVILWGLNSLKGTVPAIMHALVNGCCINPIQGNAEARKIPGLALLDPPEGGDTIQIQKTGGTLLEELELLGKTYGVAFGVRFNPSVPRMEFWTRWGKNRSIHQTVNNPVLYSTELDDVLSSEYSYNAKNWRNVALVAGEDSGNDRAMITVLDGADEPVWPHRRETFIDARDLQSDADPDKPLTAEEYSALLANRGREKLAENQLVRSFSAKVRTYDPTYQYGKDFQLGDIITVADERLGITIDAVAQGVEQSVGARGESIFLALGYGQPTIYDIVKRKADK